MVIYKHYRPIKNRFEDYSYTAFPNKGITCRFKKVNEI